MTTLSVCGVCEKPMLDQEEHECDPTIIKAKKWFNHLAVRTAELEKRVTALEAKVK